MRYFAIVLALSVFALEGCRPASSPPVDRSITGFAEGPGGRMFYEMYHPEAEGTPVLMIHGGPGSSSCYFGLLDEYITDRPVIRYDQLETGRSDRPGDQSRWHLPHFVQEVDAIRAALQLDSLHIMGLSWGGTVAAEYALEANLEGVASLILAGPLLSTARWLEDADYLVGLLPNELQETIREHEAAGTTSHPAYVAATDSFYARFAYHQQPQATVPECQGVSGNSEVYNTMWGPTEFASTGTLLGYDRTDRLHEIGLPVLFIVGEFDEARPSTMEQFAALMPDARVRVVAGAGHVSMVDKPAEVAAELSAFMARVEAR